MKNQFLIYEQQEQILKSGAATTSNQLDEEFFEALKRVQDIHSKVKVLVRSNQQTAGLEIMEEMALFQETGYEKLYRWSQSQTRSLTQVKILLKIAFTDQ